MNSSLHERTFACPGEEIHFECATSGSQTLTWTSEIYLGPDSALHFTYDSPVNVSKAISGTMHYGMLMDKSMKTGRISLTAALHIVVLESIRDRSHSITCLNADVGTSTTIAFHLAGMHMYCLHNCTHSNTYVHKGMCTCIYASLKTLRALSKLLW